MIEQKTTRLRLELINDLAYGMKSHQQTADIHGLSLEGIEQFASTWSHVIDMARCDRYVHLCISLWAVDDSARVLRTYEYDESR